jgi:hypothetical protein
MPAIGHMVAKTSKLPDQRETVAGEEGQSMWERPKWERPKWPARSTAASRPDPEATQVRDPGAAHARSAGFLTIGTVIAVVGALGATLLGGGLAGRHSDILDGNTWLIASAHGVERLLRVNPGSGDVDLDVKSPLPAGHPATLQQSNVTTAVVDAATGDTYAWNPVNGQWVRSTTRVDGDTALHLTASAAFAVDRATGTVRQLDPATLSAPVGAPIELHGIVSDSVVDGSGQLWLALGAAKQVVSVQSSASGPTLTHRFDLGSSGKPLTLTALTAGVMAGDAAAGASYRLFPNHDAAERIRDVPLTDGLTAASSDDDTGAVLDQENGTLTRVAPAGDKRAATVRLAPQVASHSFGRPVVFGNDVYVPDYTAGDVLRSTPAGTLATYPPTSLSGGGGERFDLYVDDGRLWVNARGDTQAFDVDRAGRWQSVTKFKQGPIKVPTVAPTRDQPAVSRTPVRLPNQHTGRTGAPSGGPTATSTGSPVPTVPPTTPTHSPTQSPTQSPTPPPPPGAPTGLAALGDDGILDVAWNPPADGTGPSGYRLTWTGPDGVEQNTTEPGTARQFRISGLANGSTYTVTASAIAHGQAGAAATTTGTPLTTAGVTLTGASASGIQQLTVGYDVQTHNSGVVTCDVLLNGEVKASAGCGDGAGSATITGLAYSTTYSVQVRATNPKGPTPSATQSVSTWAAPSVTITKGKSAVGYGSPDPCEDPSCAWIDVSIQHFTPGVTYTMTADASYAGGFPTHDITAGADGSAAQSGPNLSYYYGFQNKSVWVFVNGVESNHILWTK